MQISYNWLKDFIHTDKTPDELSGILTATGLEVEGIKTVQRIPGGLEGLVVGAVESCVPHPNADRLRITQVNIGGDEPLQVVCGAPNVAAGQRVILAPVGAQVHPVSGTPFTIQKAKIRGEISEGMICAEDEIGLGAGHDGIMVLPADAPVGIAAKKFFNIEDDYVFEIGLTPNRADAASHLGVVRDIAAFLRDNYHMPDISAFEDGETDEAFPVDVVDAEGCPRYSSLSIEGVQVCESPDWMKERLIAIGVRPINNVVDATNYVLHELGQPLHAFDADAISGGRVVVRKATVGETFTTLDGVERKLDENDLMICDAEKPLCIAGVFGGMHSGVTVASKRVFLESAYFDPVTVRKTSKRHGLKTDASFRFERGTDPDMTLFALKRAALLIVQLAGGKITTPVSDVYPVPIAPFVFDVRYKRIQAIIGKAIPSAEIKAIILALDIGIRKETADTLTVEVPPYRVDVTREVDIAEEVLRIYGYNNVETQRQIKASLTASAKPDKETVQHLVADLLVGNGFREILSNSLTKLDYIDDPTTAVRILNPLSADLDVMRQNMLFSALEALEYNQKRKHADLKFFEFGSSYHLQGEGYKETQHLALTITGKQAAEQWNHDGRSVSFYHIKAAVDAVLGRLGIRGLQIADTSQPHYQYGLTYLRGAKPLVTFGAVDPRSLRNADVDGGVFYADFDWGAVLKAIRNNRVTYREISKFPAVQRDLALLVDADVKFSTLKAIAERTERKLLRSVSVFDVYRGDKLPPGKKSYALHFVLQDEEKTLTDKQIDAIVKKLINNFEKETGAEIRK